MTLIFRDKGGWRVVEWQSVRKECPVEVYLYPRLQNAVEIALEVRAAKVIATCIRREDARILARERNRRERVSPLHRSMNTLMPLKTAWRRNDE
jgi:hypothetical protein